MLKLNQRKPKFQTHSLATFILVTVVSTSFCLILTVNCYQISLRYSVCKKHRNICSVIHEHLTKTDMGF